MTIERMNNIPVPVQQVSAKDIVPVVQSESVGILTQEEGLEALNKFLQRKAGFETLSVFTLDTSDSSMNRIGKDFYRFYLGMLEGETVQRYGLNIRLVKNLGHSAQQIFAVPKMAHIGEKPYYWLELSEKFTEDVTSPPFLSFRLQPDQPVDKIDSKHWRSLEEQLLVDFIRGENDVKSSDLEAFLIKLNHNRLAYNIGAAKELGIHLYNNPNIKTGDLIRVIPQTDPQTASSWIDLYKYDPAKRSSIKVSAYRILRNEKRLLGERWKDPENQTLVDYLSGNPDISFRDLAPLRAKVQKKTNIIYIGRSSEKSFLVDIEPSIEISGDEVVLIPNQDPNGFYQWLDVHKIDPETGSSITEVIASARMIRGVGLIKRGWVGAERQCLFDYSNFERSFEDLLPISLKVGTNTAQIKVLEINKTRISLTLSVKSGLKTGDNVVLMPVMEENNSVIFRLLKDNVDLGTYSFNRETKKLTQIELNDVRPFIQPRDVFILYSESKMDFNELKPIRLKARRNSSTINICQKKNNTIYICIPVSFNLAPGDEIELVPVEEVEGQAIFDFTKAGKVLGRYRFDKQSRKFYRYDTPEKSAMPEDVRHANDYLRDLVFGEEEV